MTGSEGGSLRLCDLEVEEAEGLLEHLKATVSTSNGETIEIVITGSCREGRSEGLSRSADKARALFRPAS
jgi:hypothetical protein